jgi:hypothetical protein
MTGSLKSLIAIDCFKTSAVQMAHMPQKECPATIAVVPSSESQEELNKW